MIRVSSRDRRGFVMLTTLWVISVASVVAMGAALIGRRDVMEGSARVELERGRWIALACERRTQATVDELLQQAPSLEVGAEVWRTLNRHIAGRDAMYACDIELEAAGTRLDLNSASKDMVASLLTTLGYADQASAMSDALNDWRDADDDPQPLGAERGWYLSQNRLPPRNGPLADVAEIHRVRGFEDAYRLDTLVTIEGGRVSLSTASVPVLMSVPGITRETAEQIAARAESGSPISDLLAITGSISQASASALAERFPDASRATTADPDAWIARVRVSRGLPKVSVVLEWRLIRAGKQCVVAHTRSFL